MAVRPCRRIDASDSRVAAASRSGLGPRRGPARAAHRGRAGLTWLQAASVALPAAMVYAFVCLSAWYVARSLPIKTTGTARILFTGLVSSTLSSAVWLAVAGAAVGPGGARLAAGVGAGRRLPSLFFGFGVLLYLLALAVGYLLVLFEESRATDRRTLEVQVLARKPSCARSVHSSIRISCSTACTRLVR